MTYTFHLQKVLDLRVRTEEEQNRRLASAFHELSEARAVLVRLNEDLTDLQERYSLSQTEQVDVPSVLLACNYVNHLLAHIRQQEYRLAECEKRLEEQRRITEKAVKDRKIIDTLREKDYLEFKKEASSAEQRSDDEVAIRAFGQGMQQVN